MATTTYYGNGPLSPDAWFRVFMKLSTGCILCYSGAKMVLFITGRCHRSCWYCPLSSERKGRDVVYANEHRITLPEEAIHVAGIMDALGTGITGGEPLLCLDRVVTYCSALKNHFGIQHHIHLYTAKAPTKDELQRLQGCVDEIRFHPPHECWEGITGTDYVRSAQQARELGFSVGLEVPALPGLDHLSSMLPYLDFLNINELEWGETNADAMRDRGYVPADDIHNAVEGARAWAALLEKDPRVHFCSSVFKDSVQLRRRLVRIARNTARPFDEITDDGTVVYGVIEPENDGMERCRTLCIEEFGEGGCQDCGDHIETAWWLLADARDRVPGRKSVVERYPDNGIVVEVTPL